MAMLCWLRNICQLIIFQHAALCSRNNLNQDSSNGKNTNPQEPIRQERNIQKKRNYKQGRDQFSSPFGFALTIHLQKMSKTLIWNKRNYISCLRVCRVSRENNRGDLCCCLQCTLTICIKRVKYMSLLGLNMYPFPATQLVLLKLHITFF